MDVDGLVSNWFIKVVVSGGVVDVYRYEKMPQESTKTGLRIPADLDDLDRFRAGNMRRSRWQFIRTANANFDAGSKFHTYTFRDGAVSDVTDVRECNRAWDKYLKKLRRRYGDFRWLLATEFQDKHGRGAVHYHVMTTLPYLPKEEVEELWGNGFVWLNRIEHVDNVGAYVSKYMAEDLGDPRLRGLKAWRGSHNLKKPLILRGDEARDFLEGHAVVERSAVYNDAYTSEYHGTILYRQYNLMRQS